MTDGIAPPESEIIDVPMPDGVCLSARRYLGRETPAPVVLSLTPYGKDEFFQRLFCESLREGGFEVLVADVRGTGSSGGRFEGFLSAREAADGVELVEWASRQSFCTGEVGLAGMSYAGANQLTIAGRRPRALRCIAPCAAPIDLYRDVLRRGGIVSHVNWGAYASQVCNGAESERRLLSEFYCGWMQGELDVGEYVERSPERALSKIEVPALFLGGWYDYFARATIRAFEGCPSPKSLLVSASGHDPIRPEREMGALLAWLGYWLRGIGESPIGDEPVWLQDACTHEWGSFPGWPAAGQLAWTGWHPVETETTVPVADSIRSAPPADNPPIMPLIDIATDSGMHLWGETWTIESQPMQETARLLGPVVASLELRCEGCPDLDVHVRLSVVGDEESPATQLTEGRLRTSHRELDLERSQVTACGDIAVPWHAHQAPEPIADHVPIVLEVEMSPLLATVSAGQRLRLGLTLVRVSRDSPSSATPRAELGPSTRVLLPRHEAAQG